MTNNSSSCPFCKIMLANGIDATIDAAQKIVIDFFLPIFCESQPVKIIPSHDDAVAKIITLAISDLSKAPNCCKYVGKMLIDP